MLMKESHVDLPTSTTPIRVFIIEPNLPDYPEAKFPAVVVWSEIYNATGPVLRFASQIASQGYIVACPTVFHEFTSPDPLPYDTAGTDDGNRYKAEKKLGAYDEDAKVTIDHLLSLPNCTGRIGTTGMCLGGHLAFRTAFDPRISSATCFFATDIHQSSLGTATPNDVHSLDRVRCGDLQHAEVLMIFGKQDTHVPREGRDLIRKTLEDADVTASFFECQAQHAFIRDTSSKGRYDAALTRECFGLMMELFNRTIARNLGPRRKVKGEVEHVC